MNEAADAGDAVSFHEEVVRLGVFDAERTPQSATDIRAYGLPVLMRLTGLLQSARLAQRWTGIERVWSKYKVKPANSGGTPLIW